MDATIGRMGFSAASRRRTLVVIPSGARAKRWRRRGIAVVPSEGSGMAGSPNGFNAGASRSQVH